MEDKEKQNHNSGEAGTCVDTQAAAETAALNALSVWNSTQNCDTG